MKEEFDDSLRAVTKLLASASQFMGYSPGWALEKYLYELQIIVWNLVCPREIYMYMYNRLIKQDIRILILEQCFSKDKIKVSPIIIYIIFFLILKS